MRLKRKHAVFLDRNAVREIRKNSNLERIRTLKRLDKKKNWIFMVLAPIEEKNDRPNNFLDSATPVASFFKNAATDTREAIENASLAYTLEIGFKDNGYDRLLLLYNSLKPELNRKRALRETAIVENFIFGQSDKYKIPRWHPLVLTSLAALYENAAAIDLLKYGKRINPHNPLSDILLLVRIARISRNPKWKKMFQNDLKLVTFDDGLKKIWLSLDIRILGNNLRLGLNRCPVKRTFFPKIYDRWKGLKKKIVS